jgi:hypothetical protein
MSDQITTDDRLLSVAERALVAQSKLPIVATLDKNELQMLGRRLREARDRARKIGNQQKREMLGKASPRGATPARANEGTEAKAQALVDALRRVNQAMRKLLAPSQAELSRKALAAKQAATPPTRHPEAGPSSSKGMSSKTSKQPTVRADPREVGRVSQAGKVAQARRDRRA